MMNTHTNNRPYTYRRLARTGGILVFIILANLVPAAAFRRPGEKAPAEAQSQFESEPAPPILHRDEPFPAYSAPATAVRQPGPSTPGDTPPDGVDLDITFVRRTPLYYAYCVTYAGGLPDLCPGTEGEKRWPDPGEVVTFTAQIVNKGTQSAPGFTYQWRLDDSIVFTGTLPSLAPAATVTATYQWSWGHTMDGERVVDDHTIGFVVDPQDIIAETYESNNTLTDRTNAIALHLAITPAMVAAYDVPWDPAFSYSAEDWLQRQIAAFNGALAASVYPVSPLGATDRVRIDRIIITESPPINDGTADGGWFVDADYRLISAGYDPVADVDWNLIHELSHQIGLIDLYNSNVSVDSVDLVDRHSLPVNFAFTWARPGLMGGGDIAPHGDSRLYSSHSAGAVTVNKGYRRGYYGEYQFDLPADNHLLLLDNAGHPASGVDIALFQRSGERDWTGAPSIDSTPEITGTTGLDGRVLLANRPVGGGAATNTGHALAPNPFGIVDVIGQQNRFLLHLQQGTHEEFHWVDITAFNLAFWEGDVVSHTMILNTRLPTPAAPPPPLAVMATVEGSAATICWGDNSAPSAAAYHVYRAAPPQYNYERIAESVPGPCAEDIITGSRVYGVTAVDAAGLESGFGMFVWAPRLMNPSSVAFDSSGQRLILDPQNGHALLWQQPDNRFWRNVGSPHYHFERSRFLAIDSLDRLFISHPGDWYNDRHSVRVADANAAPLMEFGRRGSAPGEFETPTGVAAWGDPCTIEGPYDVDPHTLLLLHFDGTYDGAQGEVGAPHGTSFAPGRYDKGLFVDNIDTLTYQTDGNLNRTTGAIEFWLRPEWSGADGNSYTFFEVGDGWFNRMRIMKDGANNLRFMVWDDTTEYDVARNVAHWVAGEWHHIAVSWTESTLALYVDGDAVASRDDVQLPTYLAATFHIGSNNMASQQANATIDEFRSSDVVRLGNSDSCTYRIFVADGGNHRLQAFDGLGNFVAEFGGPGSGPGQFNWPRGLAIDAQGRILVADSGNDRIQLLTFDGHAFAYADTYTADLRDPHDVAVDASGNVVVADTGHDAIKLLDADGTWLVTYMEPDTPYSGSFLSPQGVAVEADGTIVVADTGRQRVVTVRRAPLTERFYLPLVLWGDGDACADAVTNGGFEEDGTWQMPVTPYPAVYSAEQAYSGVRSLRTGIADPGHNIHSYSSAWQAVTIPGDATAASLDLWLYPVRTGDTAAYGRPLAPSLSPGASFPLVADAQYILLLDAHGQRLASLFWAQRDDAQWVNLTFDLLPFAGRTLRLHIGSYNDGAGAATALYADEVSLPICRP